MKKVTGILLAMVMLVGLLAGCSTKAPTSSSSKEEKSSDDKKSIGITIQSLENNYWAGVFGEVEKILKDEEWDYSIQSCDDNSAKQIEQIENFITKGVDLIMVHPSDPKALEDVCQSARDAGIIVMCWDDKMTNTDLNWVLNNEELGKAIGGAAADFIKEHYTADNKAKIAYMNYPQTPILLDRENGITAGLEEGAKGLYEVVAKQPGLEADNAQTAMESILQANPDVKIVCSIGAGGDIGANQAFMEKTGGKIPDDMGIFSADATLQQLEAIKNGEATRCSVGFEGSNLKTAQAVTALYNKLVKGEKIDGLEDGQNLYRPILPINIDNVDEYMADYK